jgi:hypothetical protein
MKKLLLLLTLSISLSAFSQHQYEVLVEQPNEKTLKGIISRQVLLADTTFKWYAEALKGYTVRADAKEALGKQKDSIRLIVFIGTWCEDSHFIIPKLYATTDAAGFPEKNITLIGVDRQQDHPRQSHRSPECEKCPHDYRDEKRQGTRPDSGVWEVWDV